MVVIGGLLIARGDTGAGALIAMLFVISQLIAAVNQSADLMPRAADSARVGRRLASWWNPTDAEHAPTTGHPGRLEAVRARDVGFSYGVDPAVAGVDVNLVHGEVACLTGATGAGKTTLGLLLTGILVPDTGHVRCNDDPDWGPRDLDPGRALYLGTRPILLEGSVRDNLLLPDEDAARADLDWFERATGLATDTPLVGPNGTGVSSGQAQLIALARVIVRDPELVVFDEATSALDMPREAQVQRDLLDWCRRRITLVISHRTCPWTEQADRALTLGRP